MQGALNSLASILARDRAAMHGSGACNSGYVSPPPPPLMCPINPTETAEMSKRFRSINKLSISRVCYGCGWVSVIWVITRMTAVGCVCVLDQCTILKVGTHRCVF